MRRSPAEARTAAREIMRAWAERRDRAVIFDFNGTLSDDEPILERVFGELFEEHLGWRMSPLDYRRLLGHSDREIVEIAVREHGNDDPLLVDEIMPLRSRRYQEIVAERSPISADAVRLVERLAAAGVPMGVVTGAQRADVRAVIDSSPVGPHISALVTDEDVAAGKPDPSGFRRCADMLGVRAENVLVFEDSVPGVRGALAAGMACIAVTGPAPDPEVLELAPAAVTALSAEILAAVPL